MIDVKQVRELIELMVEHDLGEIRIREGETAISLRKGVTGSVGMAGAAMPVAPVAPPAAAPAPPEAAGPAKSVDDGLIPITSPMVGTFYLSPDPDSPQFVEIGSTVHADSPICIIEAMKVFNEIKAEVSGTIERILAQDQQAVEFGQPLMLVRPTS